MNNMNFGWKQRLAPTPQNVIKLATAIKTLAISLAAITYFTTPGWIIGFAVLYWVTDIVKEFFGETSNGTN